MKHKMEDKEYRKKIVDFLKINKLYAVIWQGHSGLYFVILQNIRRKDPEIYSAIFESYYDLIQNDKEIYMYNGSYDNHMKWKDYHDLIFNEKFMKDYKKYNYEI